MTVSHLKKNMDCVIECTHPSNAGKLCLCVEDLLEKFVVLDTYKQVCNGHIFIFLFIRIFLVNSQEHSVYEIIVMCGPLSW